MSFFDKIKNVMDINGYNQYLLRVSLKSVHSIHTQTVCQTCCNAIVKSVPPKWSYNTLCFNGHFSRWT